MQINNYISSEDKFFIAGGNGMAGNAIKKKLKEKGYGNINEGGAIFSPSRKELDLLNKAQYKDGLKKTNQLLLFLPQPKWEGFMLIQSIL